MEDLPVSYLLSIFSGIQFHLFSLDVLFSLFGILLLLFFSAFISASEVAYFSLTSAELEEINNDNVHKLLERPNELLATILIANNFINVGIVVISAYFTSILILCFLCFRNGFWTPWAKELAEPLWHHPKKSFLGPAHVKNQKYPN